MTATALAAVVIMYHPEDRFIDNIYTYLDFIDKLYIIDNTEVHNEHCFSRLKENGKVVILADGVNHGIAEALNIACEKGCEEGFNWMLTMDQDSYFEKAVLDNYILEVTAFEHKDEVAVFGLPYDKDFLAKVPASQTYIDVESLITSGSLINLSHWQKIHGFNKKLFIDEVDHEYCYRAKIAGLRVICVRAGLMRHSLGKTLLTTNIRGTIKKKTLHAPLRIYYIVRNGIYVYTHFRKTFPGPAAKRLKLMYVAIKNNILYGDHRLQVCRYALLGLWHAIINRYYKL
jgi:rhamnosyltransferase